MENLTRPTTAWTTVNIGLYNRTHRTSAHTRISFAGLIPHDDAVALARDKLDADRTLRSTTDYLHNCLDLGNFTVSYE
jgi:hypothetical protein